MKGKYDDKSKHHQDTIAFYFVMTPITTVGYGDISATNYQERVFCIFLLFVGVITFAFASGQMASIITSNDFSNQILNQKLETLEAIKEQY